MSALDEVIVLVEARGFYRDDEWSDDNVTFWTCDDWAEWWSKPGDPDAPRKRRRMFLLEVLADIIGHESGWKEIRLQPPGEGPLITGPPVFLPPDDELPGPNV